MGLNTRFIVVLFLIGLVFTRSKSAFAYDIPDGEIYCQGVYQNYTLMDKKKAEDFYKSYYNKFDIILIGTVVKANDIAKISHDKRIERDWYIIVKPEEIFKIDKDIKNNLVTLYAPGGLCLNTITEKEINNKYLMFIKYDSRFRKPLLWRATDLDFANKRFPDNLKLSKVKHEQQDILNREINILRKLSKHKTLKQRWDALWD